MYGQLPLLPCFKKQSTAVVGCSRIQVMQHVCQPLLVCSAIQGLQQECDHLKVGRGSIEAQQAALVRLLLVGSAQPSIVKQHECLVCV